VLENNSANPLEGQWTEKSKIEMNFEEFTLYAAFLNIRIRDI
jgi:GH43 family beta-xylosidase